MVHVLKSVVVVPMKSHLRDFASLRALKWSINMVLRDDQMALVKSGPIRGWTHYLVNLTGEKSRNMSLFTFFFPSQRRHLLNVELERLTTHNSNMD